MNRAVTVRGQGLSDEDIDSKVCLLLDIVTPKYFKDVSADLLDLPIARTPELLTKVTNTIFEKALEEKEYTGTFARLCRSLINVETTDARGAPVKFRSLLLERIQRYFEKTDQEVSAGLEDKSEPDPKKAAEEKEKAKRRYLGNIRFISELFKFEMVTDRVIVSCFQRLLPKKPDFSDADEEKLECLCTLLTNCAKSVKQPEKLKVEAVYEVLKEIIVHGNVSPRISSLMVDVIDRKNDLFDRPTHSLQSLGRGGFQRGIGSGIRYTSRGGLRGGRRGGLDYQPLNIRPSKFQSTLSSNDRVRDGVPAETGNRGLDFDSWFPDRFGPQNGRPKSPVFSSLDWENESDSEEELVRLSEAFLARGAFKDDSANLTLEIAGMFNELTVCENILTTRDVITRASEKLVFWELPKRVNFVKLFFKKFLEKNAVVQVKLVELWMGLVNESLFPEDTLYEALTGIMEATDETMRTSLAPGVSVYESVAKLVGPLMNEGFLSLDLINVIFDKSGKHSEKYKDSFGKWRSIH